MEVCRGYVSNQAEIQSISLLAVSSPLCTMSAQKCIIYATISRKYARMRAE